MLLPGIPPHEQAQVRGGPGIVMLPPASLTPSETNPRKTMDPAALAELAASIRTHGVQVALLVRYDRETAEYRIVSGQRRHKAAVLAGLAEVPCMVRELTDAEVDEIQVVENLQREELPPLEEADAYAALAATLGGPAAVAARVGKPVEYITRRLKLVSLLPASREAFAARLLTLDHALLLAKLGAAEQEQALRFVLDRSAVAKTATAELIAEAVKRREACTLPGRPAYCGRYWEPASATALKGYIEREIRLGLKAAPWDLADAELVASAGACTSCPKNTGFNRALFSDLAIEEASCSDAACFEAKRAAFVERGIAAAKAAGKDAVRVSWKRSGVKPKWGRSIANPKYGPGAPGESAYVDGGPDTSRVLLAGQWIGVNGAKCAHARPGLTVDFGEYDVKQKPGLTLTVCIAAGCTAHPKDWEKQAGNGHSAGGGRSGGGGYDAKAEQARREQARLAIEAENKLRLELGRRAVEKTGKLSAAALRDLLYMALDTLESDVDVEALLAGVRNAVRAPMDSALFAQAVVAMWLANAGLETNEYRGVEHGRKDFVAALKVLGVDASKAWETPAPAKAESAKPAAAKAVAKPAKKAVAKKPVAKKAVKAAAAAKKVARR
jgi:ParB/RepB/Spo0J family partition protein